MDFSEIFEVAVPAIEIIARSALLYIGILFIMRVLPRRTAGELATMDLIFILIIAEAASHALGDFKSVTEGFIAIGTLVGLNYLVNMLSYHFKFFEDLVAAPPLQIVKNGKIIRRNMRREYISEEELIEQLRKQGMDDLSQVKDGFVESDGKVSFTKRRK